ncbi:MAG: hypothetical protein ACRDIF_07025, partial [Actinomycetota bacterium]
GMLKYASSTKQRTFGGYVRAGVVSGATGAAGGAIGLGVGKAAGGAIGKLRGLPRPWSAPKTAAGLADDVLRLTPEQSWGNPSSLARHFRDHGADFGARSADDYAGQASEFFQRAQQQRTRIDADGVIRVYDPASNTFGAYNPNGTTRTFFRPTNPTYWDRQPGSSPWPG